MPQLVSLELATHVASVILVVMVRLANAGKMAVVVGWKVKKMSFVLIKATHYRHGSNARNVATRVSGNGN